MKKSRGFTLIELLVVVAIIALLIAILLPSLAKAKTQSVRAKCLAVLKNWGTMINMYASENGGTFIIKNNGQGWNSTGSLYGSYWAAKFNTSLRVCPGSTAAAITANTTAYSMVAYNPSSYQMTWQAPGDTGHSNGYRLVNFKNASASVLMIDTAPGAANPWFSSMTDVQMTSPSLHDSLFDRHQGTGGALFIDGHCETEKFADYATNIPSMAPPPAAEASKPWTLIVS